MIKKKPKTKKDQTKVVVQGCTFTAMAGQPLTGESLAAVVELSKAVMVNAEAVYELAKSLQGTLPGSIGTAVNIGG